VTPANIPDFSELGAVLFDLDGTLVDSLPQVGEAAAEAMRNLGYEVTPEQILSVLGPPLVDVVGGLLNIDRDDSKRVYREYVRVYAEKYIPRTRAMPGALSLLDALVDIGLPLAVVTNKLEEAGRAVVEVMGWEARFFTVVGNDTAARPKPHADPALHALQMIDVPPERAILVGDSAADMGCAVNAGLRSGIAMKGLTSEAALREAGASHYCSDLAALLVLLRDRSS
jgi:phosphoglycolate phosphatase